MFTCLCTNATPTGVPMRTQERGNYIPRPRRNVYAKPALLHSYTINPATVQRRTSSSYYTSTSDRAREPDRTSSQRLRLKRQRSSSTSSLMGHATGKSAHDPPPPSQPASVLSLKSFPSACADCVRRKPSCEACCRRSALFFMEFLT